MNRFISVAMKGRLFFLFLLLIAAPAYAFKCGRFIIDYGTHKDDVYEYCGEPDSTESRYGKRGSIVHGDVTSFHGRHRYPSGSSSIGQAYYQEEEVLIEDWVYDFGRTKLRKLLRFENGRLVVIESLGRHRRR